ncbi:MFS general substrate transporter [Microthyrium microscopicum]|uniref:MFS general substrate transporter n=1 Tax=Microthyrium microscopicum TaxID=703497 RepID=A0A6A6UW96_9PEZI|nr:MFS general substrate transporter [Microthyrium microscopicum]
MPPRRPTKLDPFGLPLEPQPVPDDNDPLTWDQRRKVNILILISLMSFLSQFLAMDISSALWSLHKYFGVTYNRASYTIGSYIALMGVAPFLWNPLSGRIGRRPLLIASLLGTAATATMSGLSRSYIMIIIARCVNGAFAAIPIGLGSVIVCDLFYQHERGFYLGIYMVVQITGAHMGPTLSGYIYKGINWHWCFYIPAIAAGIVFIVVAATFPETLYSRNVASLSRPNMTLYQREYLRKKREDGRKLDTGAFLRPFMMLRYPSIVLPSIYYAVTSGYANFIFFTTSSVLFHHYYNFRTWQIGLLLGLPMTFGSWLGEFGAGGFSDWVTERRAVNRSGKRIPEDRLYAMLPGVILAPTGLIIEALCLQHRTHWVGPGLGIGIASAGFQIITTVTYAYTAECYPRQTSETATILNFGRQMFSFCLGFYNFHFLFRFGVQTAWLVYACAQVACFVPMVALMLKGAAWREQYPGPDWNLDL